MIKNGTLDIDMKNKDQILLENLYRTIFEINSDDESEIKKIEIEELLPDKNNMEIAVDSLRKGMYASTDKPIEVYPSDEKFIVADGHHRLLQSIINGKSSVIVKILHSDKPISKKGTIELDFYAGDYYGLDETLENGWLIKRL